MALDDTLVAAGLAALFAVVGRVEVIAADLVTMTGVIADSLPEVLIVSPSLGGISLLGRMSQLASRFQATRIVVCLREHDPAVEDVVRLAGAVGVISYRTAGAQVVARTEALLAGSDWDALGGTGGESHDSVDDFGIHPCEPLSELQWRLVELFAQGNTVVAVAERLHRSTKAIEYHRHEIRRKLGIPASNRLEWGRARRYPKES